MYNLITGVHQIAQRQRGDGNTDGRAVDQGDHRFGVVDECTHERTENVLK